jgi:hypothetical protein
MFGRLGRAVGSMFGGSNSGPPVVAPQVVTQTVAAYFAPGPANVAGVDKIAATVFPQPWYAPGQIDGNAELPAVRAQYEPMYRTEPSIRSAIRGKVDAISCLEVSVQALDKHKPNDVLAAEFCKWTIGETDHGWEGLFDLILTPACIQGYSISEKTLEPVQWPDAGKILYPPGSMRPPYLWGLRQVRSMDPAWLRLELDQFRNVVGLINLIRGLEAYSPDNVILYSHNSLYHNPFGQSDLRACTRAANILADAYHAWFIAVKVYGEPYMLGTTKHAERIGPLTNVMQAMRGGGYAATLEGDTIEVINLAAATGTSMFNELIKTLREDVYMAIRGAYTPFLEGSGGQDSHNDTQISEDAANTTELAMVKHVCRVVRRQLFPWLVLTNFPAGTGIPQLKLGGTNWDQTAKFCDAVKKGQESGGKISAAWYYETTGFVAAASPDDVLKPEEKPPGAGQPGAPPGAGGAPPGAAPPALPPKPSDPSGGVDPEQVTSMAEALLKRVRGEPLDTDARHFAASDTFVAPEQTGPQFDADAIAAAVQTILAELSA